MNEKVRKNGRLVPIITVLVLLISFVYPRLLISWLGTANPWTCYLYQYGLGLVTFGVGILLILKTGACQLGRGRDSYWFKWLIAGMIIFMLVHAIWIVFALSYPVKGGM